MRRQLIGLWGTVVLPLVWMGCLPVKPPVVVPATMTVSVEVYDAATSAKVPGATLSYWYTGPTPDSAVSQQADAQGNTTFVIPRSTTDSHMWASAEGYLTANQHVDAAPFTIVQFQLARRPPPAPVYPEPQRLHVDGILFKTADGSTWRWKGVTSFLLYKQWLEGRDITPLLAEYRAWGANLVRVLGCENWADAPFRPAEYPTYYTALPDFADFLAAQGFYLEFSAIGDGQYLMNSVAAQQEHLRKVFEALASKPNAVVEIANEPPFNGVDPANHMNLKAPAELLTASGNYDVPNLAPRLPNVRDYVTVHPDRDAEWPRKVKDPLREIGVTGFEWKEPLTQEVIGTFSPSRVPVVNDEPIGADETDQPGRRSNVVRDFRDHGAVSALFGAGATFHFEAGLRSTVPGPVQREAARAFFAGMDAIPLDAPKAEYSAGHLGNCPLVFDVRKALRTFCMMNGTEATCVIVRKEYDQPVAKNGWTITGYGADDKAIVRLAR